MRMIPTRISASMLLLALLLVAPLSAQESLMPSEAQKKAEATIRQKYAEYREALKTDPDLRIDFDAIFASTVSGLLPSVQKNGLSPEEQLILANLFSSAKQSEEARTLYDTLAAGSDDIAAKASGLRLMLLLTEKKYEEMSPLIAEHQRRFPFAMDKDNNPYFYSLTAYAKHLSEEGEHQAAVDLVLKEINRLPDPPKTACIIPNLAGEILPSFIELGKKEEALDILRHYISAYTALHKEKSANLPEGDTDEARMAKALAQQIERNIQILQATLTQATLVGKEAPAIQFSRVYNAPADLSFADLKGKVVMIDFWANWCAPCKEAFPTLRKIYDDYQEKGLVILSVTGLQSRFYDRNIAVSHLEPEEEFKLTEDFIKRYEMTWPVVFSDRGAFDPEYGISGIPTMVFMDKQGKVREVKVGFEPEEAESLRRFIEKLLSE